MVLARNYAGYASLGRPRQGRWGLGDKKETSFKMASTFLKDRHDICVPVELLAGLIDEDRCVCVCVEGCSRECRVPGAYIDPLVVATDVVLCVFSVLVGDPPSYEKRALAVPI